MKKKKKKKPKHLNSPQCNDLGLCLEKSETLQTKVQKPEVNVNYFHFSVLDGHRSGRREAKA